MQGDSQIDNDTVADIANRAGMNDSNMSLFDIKGNSFKQTLFPKQAASPARINYGSPRHNLSMMNGNSTCDITADDTQDLT